MIRHLLSASLLFGITAALVAGCNGTVTTGDEDDEPILLGGGAGTPKPPPCDPPPATCDGTITVDGEGCQTCVPDECPDPPVYCVQVTTDENGCQVCDHTSCDMCTEDQICSTCNYANGYSHTCHDVPTPTADQFVCKWITCNVGEICLDTQPAGDGCPDAGCEAVPPGCEADPTCACLEAALGANACTEDEDGNVTVTGYFF